MKLVGSSRGKNPKREPFLIRQTRQGIVWSNSHLPQFDLHCPLSCLTPTNHFTEIY